jgi:glycosyltransferase involved in cell wall biosynthesis
MPLFSVVICTYNRSQRLTRALDSVLSQHESDFEVIVVDDGSEDDTADVVAGYESPLIRYVRRVNGGLSAARNTGIDNARGEFVVFLDDDDRVEPMWLSTLGSEISAGTGIVSCGCWFDSPDDGSSTVVLPAELPEAFNRVRALFLAGTFAVRRALYHQVGGYAEDIPTSHQTELALRLLPELERVGLTVLSVDKPLLHIERRAAAQRLRRPEDLLVGTQYLLDHHGDQLANSPTVLADYHAVAAVSAFQIGDRSSSRQHFRAALRANPTQVRHAARYALSHVPALANRFWGRHGTMAP